jgi:hypothetical protein
VTGSNNPYSVVNIAVIQSDSLGGPR